MRIAISGAHRTGKTALVKGLVNALRGYAAVDEPYYLLVEEGYAFSELPSLEDFEAQLERSLQLISESSENQIFDRSPFDLLAYMVCHPERSRFDLGLWIARIREALSRLDVIVYIPIESPDRIDRATVEFGDLREQIDTELRDLVLNDQFSFGVETIEVRGNIQVRIRSVLEKIGRLESRQ